MARPRILVSRRVTRNKRSISLAVLCLFVCQCLFPLGYMPASFASEGSFIKLCPAGMSDAMMAVLHKGHASALAQDLSESDSSSHAHHHHHGHHGHVQAQDTHAIEVSSSADDSLQHDGHQMDHDSIWQNQCDFAATASGLDVLAFEYFPAETVSKQKFNLQLLLAEIILERRRSKQLSRAPPYSLA